MRSFIAASTLLVPLFACSSDPSDDCPADPALGEAPVECIDWEAVAEERGFDTRPEQFFPFLQSGCFVEPTEASRTLEELADDSTAIVFGRLVEVLPVAGPQPSRGEEPDYEVHFALAVDEVISGSPPDELEVVSGCGTAGKIAGLEYALPDQTYLFFLVANDGSLGGTYGFAYFYLGIVEDGPTGARFALDPGAEIIPPPLDEFGSTAELADALRNL